MYITNPINNWGRLSTNKDQRIYSIEDIGDWGHPAIMEDLDYLTNILETNSKHISNEEISTINNIIDKYSIDTKYTISNEALSGVVIGGIVIGVMAIIAIIIILIKQMSNSISGFASSSNESLKQIANHPPKVSPTILASPIVTQIAKSNPTLKPSDANTIVKVNEHIPNPRDVGNKSDTWAKETSVVAKAYLSYLDLLGIDHNSKTLKDMGEWLATLKSYNGDLLKMISKILPSTDTVVADKVNKNLGILTMNRGYGRYITVLNELIEFDKKLSEFIQHGDYDSGFGNLVSMGKKLSETVNYLSNHKSMTQSSNPAVVELGIENIKKLLEKKIELKNFNGSFVADLQELGFDKYNESFVKQNLDSLYKELSKNRNYSKVAISQHGGTEDQHVKFLINLIPKLAKDIMSEYSADVVALKISNDFIINTAAIISTLNSNVSK